MIREQGGTRTVSTILALAHHAGGVGKTTSTLNIGYGLATQGCRGLLVGMDPQADLSDRLGVQPVAPYLAQVILEGKGTPSPLRCDWDTGIGLEVIPTTLDQAALELRLAGETNGRERRLRQALKRLRDGYDFILI